MIAATMKNGTDINGEHPLIQRFRNFATLSAEEEAGLRRLVDGPARTVAARRDLIREGEAPRGVQLILSGWAGAYRMLEDGRRQGLAFLLPGDLSDVHNVVLNEMDHSIGALTEVRYVELPHSRFEELVRVHPRLLHALRWQSMTAISVQREWTVSIGQRSAFERLCHIFCEIFLRLKAVGLCADGSCDMPATQADLAEATGLTSIHVNRMVQDMREAGLIVLKNRRLAIPDFAALQRSALFSPNYLHLGHSGSASPLGGYANSQAN